MTDKIFDREVELYLLDAGVPKKDIAKIKFGRLQSRAVERLKTITNLIENQKYDDVLPFLGYSPSGDDFGENNSFINFGYIISDDTDFTLDIEEVIKLLKEFKNES